MWWIAEGGVDLDPEQGKEWVRREAIQALRMWTG